MFEVSKQESVRILQMKGGENRVNPDFLSGINEALDGIEADQDSGALVLTGEGKFFSNGLDLEWLTGPGAEQAGPFIADFHKLFARLMRFPMVTVGALNGHAFAGGAMISLCLDFRIMRSDRGFWCLPEVDLGMPFTPGMNALIQAKTPRPLVHEAIVTGRRFSAEELLAGGVVKASAEEAGVLPAAIELAGQYAGKSRETIQAIKQDAYAAELAILDGQA